MAIQPEYPWPIDPDWLTRPYGDQGSCYGCGLEKEVGKLCFYCDELLKTLRRRARFPLWII